MRKEIKRLKLPYELFFLTKLQPSFRPGQALFQDGFLKATKFILNLLQNEKHERVKNYLNNKIDIQIF